MLELKWQRGDRFKDVVHGLEQTWKVHTETEDKHGIALVGLPAEGEMTHNMVSWVCTRERTPESLKVRGGWVSHAWWEVVPLILTLAFSHSVCCAAAPGPAFRGPGGWVSSGSLMIGRRYCCCAGGPWSMTRRKARGYQAPAYSGRWIWGLRHWAWQPVLMLRPLACLGCLHLCCTSQRYHRRGKWAWWRSAGAYTMSHLHHLAPASPPLGLTELLFPG